MKESAAAQINFRDGTMEDDSYFGENISYYDYFNYSNSGLPIYCDDESVSNFDKVFVPVLYILVFIIGFIGNGLVLCVLLKHIHKSNLTDMCLLNLCVSDLLFLLTLPLFAHYFAMSHWYFGTFLCHVSGGLHSLGFYSSILFMVLMTLDRYVLIQQVQKASKYRSVKTGRILSMCVWVLSLCISLPAFVFTKKVTKPDSECVICKYNPDAKLWIEYYNIFVTNILGLVFPLSVMVACYSRIIPTLMKIRSAKKHRIVKLIICIITVFFLLWAPYNITLFLNFLQLQGILSDCTLGLRLSIAITETIAFSHCCLNPIIYAFAGQKFMKRSLVMWRKFLPGISFSSRRDLSNSSSKMSSLMSRTSVTSTVM